MILLGNNFLVSYAATYYPFNYEIITKSVMSGDGIETFYLSFPESYYYWNVFDYRGTIFSECKREKYFSFSINEPNCKDVTVGFRPSGFNILNIKNIPDGSIFEFDAFFSYRADSWPEGFCSDLIRIYFYGEDGAYLGQQIHDERGDEIKDIYKAGSFYYGESFVLEKPDYATYMMLAVNFNFLNPYQVCPENWSVSLTCERFDLKVSIDRAYLDSEIEKENNEILNNIQDQNQLLIDGTPEQNDAIDKFDSEAQDKIGALEDAGDVMDSVTTPEVDVDELVPSNVLQGQAYLTYVNTISTFWDSKYLAVIGTILGGLILISFVLFGRKG